MQRPSLTTFNRRAGFTLVEMLVALAIFVILATLTLGAFRGVSKNDQISAGTNQIKGWFEHAKSKAIHDKLPRGLRFLPDTNNPTLCSSVVYIGTAGYEDGDLTSTIVAQRKFVTLSANRLQLTASAQTATEWYYLINSGALAPTTARVHGLQIEVPRGSGYWYPITGVTATLTPSPAATLTVGRAILNQNGGLNEPLDYRIELGPTVLEGDPISLPRGVVIDLDASILPDEWRPQWNGTAWVPVDQMDIMFSPQGTFMGRIAPTIGVLHLLVSTLEDADAARNNAGGNHPSDLTTGPSRAAPFNYPFILANPKTTQKVVSVFTGSGRLATSDVYVYTFGAGGPVLFDAYANNTVNDIRLVTTSTPLLPFRNALQGKEVK